MVQNHYTDTEGAGGNRMLVQQTIRAVQDELSAITGYTTNSILLSPFLPAVAALYREISLTEMEHYQHLSELLFHLGASPYPRAQVRPTPYTLNADADSHAIVVARRMLAESIADEKAASIGYRRIAESNTDEKIKRFFSELSEDEATHAKAFCAALERLNRS